MIENGCLKRLGDGYRRHRTRSRKMRKASRLKNINIGGWGLHGLRKLMEEESSVHCRLDLPQRVSKDQVYRKLLEGRKINNTKR